MQIALVGGTGKEGRGLALRWAKAGHEVKLGSRSAERGEERAAELSESVGATIRGGDNTWAVRGADVVVLCVPYSAHKATLTGLREELRGKIVVDITVPLRPPKVRTVHLPEGESAALEAQEILGEETTVVATLHHVSSEHLKHYDRPLVGDVLVCSNNREARAMVVGLLEELGCRALEAGRLRNAIALEAMTPVLLFMNRHYKSKGTGIMITGIPE